MRTESQFDTTVLSAISSPASVQHAGDFATARQDFLDLRARAEFDAELGREFHERFGHGARAADGIPHSFVGLHVRDAAEHGGRTVGRRADVLREVVDHLRDARVGRERAHGACDRAAHAHREHVAEHLRIERRLPLEHVAQAADRLVEKVALRDAIQSRAVVDELAIARAGIRAGREGVERLSHRVWILREVEHRAVVEETAPLRVEPHKLEVILQARAGLAEDAAQHRRNRDDGRPHVEAEAVAAELRGLAAEPVVALEDRDFAPARGEHAGCGKAGESAADDADGFHSFLRLDFSMSAATNSRIEAKRCRPCAARM